MHPILARQPSGGLSASLRHLSLAEGLETSRQNRHQAKGLQKGQVKL